MVPNIPSADHNWPLLYPLLSSPLLPSLPLSYSPVRCRAEHALSRRVHPILQFYEQKESRSKPCPMYCYLTIFIHMSDFVPLTSHTLSAMSSPTLLSSVLSCSALSFHIMLCKAVFQYVTCNLFSLHVQVADIWKRNEIEFVSKHDDSHLVLFLILFYLHKLLCSVVPLHSLFFPSLLSLSLSLLCSALHKTQHDIR